MFDLTGHVALVTGAGQNVGAGIARALAAQGAALVVNDFPADRVLRVAEEINQVAPGGRHPVRRHRPGRCDRWIDEATARLGHVDVLVNNAGTGRTTEPMPMAKFAEMAPDKWAPIIAVNLFGPMNCAKAAIGSMIDRHWGLRRNHRHLAVRPEHQVYLYAAGKAGASGFMRHLAIENAKHGVTVNTISLGLVTDDPGMVGAAATSLPSSRINAPTDVSARLVCFRLSAVSWLTGQAIGLNGGAITS